MKFPKNMIG